MPTLDGKKLVSETMSRKKNQARILITVEVELPQSLMSNLPSYQTDATDYLRSKLNTEVAEHNLKVDVCEALSDVMEGTNDIKVLEFAVRADK